MSHTELADLHKLIAEDLGWSEQEIHSFSLPALASIVRDESLRQRILAFVRADKHLVGKPLSSRRPPPHGARKTRKHLHAPEDSPAQKRRDALYDLFRAAGTAAAGPCRESPQPDDGTWSQPVDVPLEMLLPYGRGKAIPHVANGETGAQRLERLRASHGSWKPIEVAFAPGCAPRILDGNHRLIVAEEMRDQTIRAQALFVPKPWWPCESLDVTRTGLPRAGNPTYLYQAHVGPGHTEEVADRLRAAGIESHAGTEAVYGHVHADDQVGALDQLNAGAGFELVSARDLGRSVRTKNPKSARRPNPAKKHAKAKPRAARPKSDEPLFSGVGPAGPVTITTRGELVEVVVDNKGRRSGELKSLATSLGEAKMLGQGGSSRVSNTITKIVFGPKCDEGAKQAVISMVTTPTSGRRQNPVLLAYGSVDKKAPSAPDRRGKPRAR